MRLDAIFRNGRFTTLDSRRPHATALGVLHGVVAGLDEDLGGCTAEHDVDLGGAPVLPGFNDAHHHLRLRGQWLHELDLGPHTVVTLDDVYQQVRRRARRLPAGAWILGSGYDNRLLGGHPDALGLDAAAAGHPVWLHHVSGHLGVANTAALARVGFAPPETVPDVAGGRVVRDDGGRPTGLLLENAQSLVMEALRPAPVDVVVGWLGAAGRAALADGLTSASEAGVAGPAAMGNSAADLDAYRIAQQRGELGLRVTVMPYITALRDLGAFEPDARWFGLDLGVRSGFGDDWLRVGPTKILADGCMTGRTAAMTERFVDTPDECGFLLFDVDELRHLIIEAHRCGWQVAAHAIGDAAIDAILDCYDGAQTRHPRADARHRIEHAGIVRDDQLQRFAALGVIPVPQVSFVTEMADVYEAALGPTRIAQAYRCRSFLDAGITVPGSSDCPIATGAPLHCIDSMVNRRAPDGRPVTPHEAITVDQAVRAYTLGSAHAAHEEHRKGSLSPGMLADFVVLSDDLYAIDPARITDVSVGATVVGGAVAHTDGAL